MKIPVELSYEEFRNLTTQKKKEELLKYLTETALQIVIKRKTKSKKVPKFSREKISKGLCYLLIAEDLFEFYEKLLVSCIFCGKVIRQEEVWGTFIDGLVTCSDACYKKQKTKNSLELKQKTGVILLKEKEILEEWRTKDPFRSIAPPEITFIHREIGTLSAGSFKWKISIPDLLDIYYWPLQKKKMKTLNLDYSPLNNEVSRIREAS